MYLELREGYSQNMTSCMPTVGSLLFVKSCVHRGVHVLKGMGGSLYKRGGWGHNRRNVVYTTGTQQNITRLSRAPSNSLFIGLNQKAVVCFVRHLSSFQDTCKYHAVLNEILVLYIHKTVVVLLALQAVF